MNAIFLSASVPLVGRGIPRDSRPILDSMCSARAGDSHDHPVANSLGWAPGYFTNHLAIYQDSTIKSADSFVLYQSSFFEEQFPEENKYFGNVVFIDAVQGDREKSLLKLREAMLSRQDLEAAVFIGGMDGVAAEYALFKRFHPDKKALLVPAPGGAALQLAEQFGGFDEASLRDLHFARLFPAG